MRPPSSAALVAMALGAGILAGAGSARADLAGDAERLRRSWTAAGARITRLRPRFLEHDRLAAVALPPPGEPSCTTVALLAGRTAEFSASPLDGGPVGAGRHEVDPGADREGGRAVSASGALMLTRCGEERAQMRRLVIELTSSRAAMEILVAHADAPLHTIDEVLPERASGPLAPRNDPGFTVDPAPLEERLARVLRRVRLAKAERVTQAEGRASPDGHGGFAVRLGEGCHRLEILADALGDSISGRLRRLTDVDAEIRATGDGRVLARDRSDAADARLELCVGAPTDAEVSFTGAAGAVRTALTDASWALPSALPKRWGPRARGAFAWALRRRNAPAPDGAPAFETLGVAGQTRVAVPVEPDRCYLAAVAVMQGESRGLRLTAALADRNARDELPERPEAAAIAFCVDEERVVPVEVESRGMSPWWVLAVWPMGGDGS